MKNKIIKNNKTKNLIKNKSANKKYLSRLVFKNINFILCHIIQDKVLELKLINNLN